MLPPHERLDADDLARVERDDRLEEHTQLLVLDRRLELRAQAQPRVRLPTHRRVEEGDAVLALFLGAVERDVGVAHQVRVGVTLLRHRDPDARGNGHRQLVDLDRQLEHVEQPVRDRHDLGDVGDAVEQHRELVAAQTRDRVARPEAFAQPVGDRGQQRVAGRVAEPVVDRLEVVEVDEHHRDRRAGPPAAQPGLVEPVEEQRAVRELGQVVVEDALLQLAGQFPLHRDVAHRHDQTGDVVVAEHVDDAHLEIALVPVVVDEHAEDLFVRAQRERDDRAQLPCDPVGLRRAERLREPAADEGVTVDTQQRARPRTRVGDLTVAVDDEDRVVETLHERAQATQSVPHAGGARARGQVPQAHRDQDEHDDGADARHQGRDVAVPGRPRVGEGRDRAQRDRREDAQHPDPVGGVDVHDRFVRVRDRATRGDDDHRQREQGRQLEHAPPGAVRLREARALEEVGGRERYETEEQQPGRRSGRNSSRTAIALRTIAKKVRA